MTAIGGLTASLADRYRIERELGRGGMATVHLAHDLRHDRDVALKVLNPDVAQSLGRERFVREIRLAARLNHPHVLPLYDSGEADGFLYFVMPVMEGQTLRDRLVQERMLPVELRHVGASSKRAEVLIQSAMEIEGESPPLRALRAFMWFSQVRAGLNTDLAPLDATEAEARALIELAPNAAYGHALLGFVAYERGEQREAARHFTRAMELDPADPDVMFHYAIALQAAGQIEPAIELGRRFHAADPLSPFAWLILCVVQWFAGRAGDRVDAMERALAMDPENPIIHWALGYTYALMGRVRDAAMQARWMKARVPEVPYTVQLSSLVDAIEGRQAAAVEALARVDVTPLDAHHTFHLSESLAMAGDMTRAVELLERAVDRGFYPYRFIAEFCPFMAPLRGKPAFERISAKAKRRVAEFSA